MHKFVNYDKNPKTFHDSDDSTYVVLRDTNVSMSSTSLSRLDIILVHLY